MKNQCEILVVDDDSAVRTAVTEHLAAQGYDTQSVCSGYEAIQQCRHSKPFLLLVDINMPGMTGLELLQRLKPKKNECEVIIITALSDLRLAKEAMEMGAYSYLTKPFDFGEMSKQVAQALRIAHSKQKERQSQKLLHAKVRGKTQELQQAYQELKAKQQFLDTIVNSMGDALVVLNENHEIVMMNLRAEDMLGVRFNRVAGVSIRKAIRDPNVLDQLMPLILEKEEKYFEPHCITIGTPRQEIRSYLVKISDLRNYDGQGSGMILCFADQTERVNAERMRSSFLSIVLHELRTPVNVLLNYLSVLELGKTGDQSMQEVIQDMKATGRILGELVADIANVAALSGSSIPIRYKQTCVAELVEGQIQSFRDAALEKELDFLFNNQLGNSTVMVDPKVFKIVMRSLISNAVKYNKPCGKVTIDLNMKESEKGKLLFVAVKDEGEGISKQDEKSLFRDFVQGENPLRRKHGGMGTGLFLVKRGVEILRGKVQIYSVNGKGTTFFLQVPVPPIEGRLHAAH